MIRSASLAERYPAAVPSPDRMMAWIAQMVGFGVRRPGTEPGHAVEGWCLSQFEQAGLEDVRQEEFDVPVWEPGEASLVVWPAGRPAERMTLAGFPLPHTRPAGALEADLVLISPDGIGNEAAEGAIAVDVIEPAELLPPFMEQVATRRIDPSGELATYGHVLPFSLRLGREVDTAIAAGAAGYVGLLSGMPWDTRDYYLPYDAVERHLSGLWVGRVDGARLMALLAEGPVRGRIEVDARWWDGWSANVIGTLPGASDEWVIVGSHHDAPWASAVEDGTGTALVLAQARFWAQVPPSERPHNLLFLLNGGHMAGATGMASFMKRHKALLDDVVLSVHLEHAAAAWRIEEGRLVAGEDPEVRWWFTSPDTLLEDAVASALSAEELERSWILPPEALGEFPPTDGGELHLNGVPLVDFLVAPVYLVDACDTLDKVHRPSLEPVTRATVRIIESLAGRTAAEVRAGCVEGSSRAPT